MATSQHPTTSAWTRRPMPRRSGPGRLVLAAMVAGALLLTVLPSRSAQASSDADRRAMLDAVRIPLDEALRISAAEVPNGLPSRIAVVRRGDAVVYSVRLLSADREMQVELDAASGAVRTKKAVEAPDDRRRELAALAPLLRTAAIGPAKAAALAAEKAPGARVLVVESDVEDDALQFEVTVLGPDGLAKAEVDAASGEIISFAGGTPQPVMDPRVRTFDHDPLGSLPKGWVAQAPGVDAPPSWAVRADPAATSPPNVLTIDRPAHDANASLLAWIGDLSMQDGQAEVRVRLERGPGDGGAGDRVGAAGLTWRLRDALDHYVVIVDGAARQLRLESVRDGQRRRIAAVPIAAEAGKWMRLGVRHDGDRIQVLVDGEPRLEASDSTLPGAGMVGVWIRGDGLARFDDLRVAEEK